ncbi:MAG TPA: hypothetical protein VG265_13135 [Gaiellaceae bacterium]|nr:hypothetical protein [Gaiellaceae bacterium]
MGPSVVPDVRWKGDGAGKLTAPEHAAILEELRTLHDPWCVSG